MSQTAKINEDDYDRLMRSACFVCRIVGGNPLVAGVQIVYEDENVIAFLDQYPTQEGYTIVSPKRHVERFETDMSRAEWMQLQAVVHRVAGAVSRATGAVRMYIASWGTPDRNNHIHIHVCPCPPGLPLKQQELAAMQKTDGQYLNFSESRMTSIADDIRAQLGSDAI